MYKLYYGPGTCSMAVHIALLECGQQPTLEKVDTRAPRTPEFLKLNPRGQVPVLLDDELVIREGAAILLHILEKHKSPLLPAAGKARDTALEWLMSCNATLHPAYTRCFFIMRALEDGAVKDKALQAALELVNKFWREVEDRLAKTPYLAGDALTMGDILLTVIANWSYHLPNPEAVVIGPRSKKLLQTVIARPAYKEALAIEQVEYKAAA